MGAKRDPKVCSEDRCMNKPVAGNAQGQYCADHWDSHKDEIVNDIPEDTPPDNTQTEVTEEE